MSDDLTPIEQEDDLTEAPVLATPSPRASLTLKRGGVATEHVFEFGSPAIVGRFDPAVGPIDIDLGSIDESSYISRKHARLWNEDGVWRVADLGSSNGTFLLAADFERIEESELTDGCEVAFGNARFIFVSEAVEEEQPEAGITTDGG